MKKQVFIPCKYPELLHYYVRYGNSFVDKNSDKEVYEKFREFMIELGIEVEDVREGSPYLCFSDNTVYHYDEPNKYWVQALAGVGYKSADKQIKTLEDLDKFKQLIGK